MNNERPKRGCRTCANRKGSPACHDPHCVAPEYVWYDEKVTVPPPKEADANATTEWLARPGVPYVIEGFPAVEGRDEDDVDVTPTVCPGTVGDGEADGAAPLPQATPGVTPLPSIPITTLALDGETYVHRGVIPPAADWTPLPSGEPLTSTTTHRKAPVRTVEVTRAQWRVLYQRVSAATEALGSWPLGLTVDLAPGIRVVVLPKEG